MIIPFGLGFLCALLIVAAAATWQVRKLSKKSGISVDDRLTSITDEIGKITEARVKFVEINQITEEQHELISHIDRPSASASHSRHKNGIIQRIKDLEERKNELFKSILDSGIDPIITMYVDGEPKQMKMSEAMEIKASTDETPDTPLTKTESKKPRGNKSHLTLVSNEENNDDSNPGNPAIY